MALNEADTYHICIHIHSYTHTLSHTIFQVSSGLLGLGARKEKQWPQELLPLARGLYNLQSSRMLASSGLPVITPDERRLLMQHLFGGDYAAVLPQVCFVCVCVLNASQLTQTLDVPDFT